MYYIYTDKQAQAIKNGDIEARNKFYIDNYKKLRSEAITFAKRYGIVNFELEEALQQVYLDLPFMDFSTPDALSTSIFYNSFRNVLFGGYSYLLEHNKKILGHSVNRPSRNFSIYQQDEENGEDLFLPDLLGCCENSPEEQYIEKNFNVNLQSVYDFLADKLSEKQCVLFRYLLNGYKLNSKKAKEYGISYSASNMQQMRKKILLHYDELKDFLKEKFDYVVPERYDKFAEDLLFKSKVSS